MHNLIQALVDLRQFKFNLDDDITDRLSRQYTSAVLLLLATVVSMRQYWGEAIHCWCPETCAPNHEKYANVYCWVDDTYYVAMNENMPQGEEGRERRITYYQWVPIILILQSAMFVLPYAIWRILNSRAGIDVGLLMDSAVNSQTDVQPEQREKTLRYCVHLMDRYLTAKIGRRGTTMGCCGRVMRIASKHCILMSGRFYGNYLTVSYLFVKLLYTVNAVGQLFLLDVFLGYEFHVLGLHVIRHLLFAEEWKASEKFPRVSMCDFKVRQNTNVHRYTVQCVLPINLFNEKIFTVVWFWFFCIAITTTFSLVTWLCRLIHWPAQYRFVKRQLSSFAQSFSTVLGSSPERHNMRRFADCYLQRDGLLVLRLVSKNAGQLVANEILSALWDNYNLNHDRILQDVDNNDQGKARHQTSTGCITGRTERQTKVNRSSKQQQKQLERLQLQQEILINESSPGRLSRMEEV